MGMTKYRVVNRLAEILAIKGRQEARKISVEMVSDETGLARNTIYLWIRNDVKRYDKDTLEVFCDYLDCEIGDLLIREAIPETSKNQITPVFALA
jgi:DNA-binding Xre family transcriptional regulator